jgi:hypothetical protein
MWSLLPLIFRPNDLKKIYDANIDGFSLRKIYNLAENYQMGQGLIFLLETTNNEAFGGLLSNFLSLTGGKFIRPIEAYLISIRPFQQVNSIQQKTDNILRCDQESIMYGNGNDGPAIYIKGDLHSGISNPNNCFSRERLTKNDNGLF